MFRKPMRLEKWIAFDGAVGVEVIEAAQDAVADDAEHDTGYGFADNPESVGNTDDADGADSGENQGQPAVAMTFADIMALSDSDRNKIEFEVDGEEVEIEFPVVGDISGENTHDDLVFPFWDNDVRISDWDESLGGSMFFEIGKPANGEFGLITYTSRNDGAILEDLQRYGFGGGDVVAVAFNYAGDTGPLTVSFFKIGESEWSETGLTIEQVFDNCSARIENGALRFSLLNANGDTPVSMNGNQQKEALEAIFSSLTFTPDSDQTEMGAFDVKFFHDADHEFDKVREAFGFGNEGIFKEESIFVLEDATQVCENGKAPSGSSNPGGEDPGDPGDEPGGSGEESGDLGEDPGDPDDESGGSGEESGDLGEDPGDPDDESGGFGEEPGDLGEDPGDPGDESDGSSEEPGDPGEPETPTDPDPVDPITPPVTDGGNTSGDAGDSSDVSGDADADSGGDSGTDSGGDSAGSGEGEGGDGVLGGDDIVNTYRRDQEEGAAVQGVAENAADREEIEEVVVAIEDRAVDSASVAVAMELAKYLESYVSTVQEDKAALELALSRLQAEYLFRNAGDWGDARFRLRDLFDSGNQELTAINRILEQMRRQIQEFRDYPADRRDGILAETIRDLLDSAERRSGETTALSVALNAVADLLQERRSGAATPPAETELAAAFNQAHEQAMNEWLAKAAKNDPMGRDLAGTVMTATQ